jgi:hypothetical protein
MNVLEGLAKSFSVSHPGTMSCSDGIHQPSEALLQEYCGAPKQTSWLPGINVFISYNKFILTEIELMSINQSRVSSGIMIQTTLNIFIKPLLYSDIFCYYNHTKS